jgi:hypothetical protein
MHVPSLIVLSWAAGTGREGSTSIGLGGYHKHLNSGRSASSSCLKLVGRDPPEAVAGGAVRRASAHSLVGAGCRLSAKRDAEAARRFFRQTLGQPHPASPRTITVDKNPAEPCAIAQRKAAGALWRSCRRGQCKFRNDSVEQDHRRLERLVSPGLGFGGLQTARRTLAGDEARATIRKGQVRGIGGRGVQASNPRHRRAGPPRRVIWRLSRPFAATGNLCNGTLAAVSPPATRRDRTAADRCCPRGCRGSRPLRGRATSSLSARNTARSVRAAAIARFEDSDWPPRPVRASARQPSTALSENQTLGQQREAAAAASADEQRLWAD